MKKSFALFTGLVLIAASLVFTGCENFFSGNNLKKELEEKIQYEKKIAYSISVELEKAEYGQCSMNTFELKEGESKALTFTLASGYNFKGWKCNDPEAVEFSPVDSVKTTITLKKGKSDLVITPVCAEVFGVKTILPEKKDGGVPCDSPIFLTFTHSIKPESLGTAGDDYKISILSENGTDLSEFYSAPVFQENNTIIKFSTIREKPIITAGTLYIEVIVKAGVESDSGEIMDEEYCYKFKANSSRDSDAPVFIDFKVTSKKPSFNKTLETLTEEYDSFKDKITIDGETLITEIPDSTSFEISEQFHIKDKLYIYCKAEDKGSGAYRLECDTISFPTLESGKKFVSTSENIYEIDDCEIDLSSYPDGEIELTFKLYDYCDNVCPDTKVYKVIKDTYIPQSNLLIKNNEPQWAGSFVDRITFYPQWGPENEGSNHYRIVSGTTGSLYYEAEDFNDSYKRIYVEGIEHDEWSDNVELFYENKGIEYKASYNEIGYFVLGDFDDSYDLKLKVVVTDSVGNRFEKTRYYPCGGISISSTISTDSITLEASKESINDAENFSYRCFYEIQWDETLEDSYNNSDETKKNLAIINNYNSTYEGESWLRELDAEGWNKSALKKLLAFGRLETNKLYVASFGNAMNSGMSCPIYGVGPSDVEFVPYRSPVAVTTGFNYATGLPSFENRLEFTYLDKNKPVICYVLPIYFYNDNGVSSTIYGKPIKKSIAFIESAYNTSYSVEFDLSEPVSSGVNTGTCNVCIQNIVIKDSSDFECTDKFNFEYYYRLDGSVKSFKKSTVKIDSVSEETEITVGFIATNVKDPSIVVKAEKSLTIQPVDNYPPFWNIDYYYATYNLYDDDRTGKNYYMNLQSFSYITRNSGASYTYGDFKPLIEDKKGRGVYSTQDLYSASGSYDYEYYWVPADDLWDLPVVEDGSFTPIQSGKSKIDWKTPFVYSRDTSYKLWVPVYDMPDGEYYLVTKVFDENGNYVLTPHLFHDVNTFMDKPKLTLDGNSLQVKLILYGQGKVDRYSDLQDAYTGIQYLGSDSVWKPINLDSKMKFYDKYGTLLRSSFGNASYIINEPVDVTVAKNRYIKCGVQGYHVMYTGTDRDSVGRYQPSGGFNRYMDSLSHEINTVPVYKFIGNSKGTYHKLIENEDEINIYCDGYTFAHVMYSTNPDGYGDNIDEWERRARELVVESWGYVYSPKQFDVDFNFYKDDIQECLPEDAKSYVVIAYFDDGEAAISKVYNK